MMRAALERPRTLRTWRRHLATHSFSLPCDCELQPGRFRKGQRVGGCGKAACWICHYSKLAGYPSLQYYRHLNAFREQVRDAEVLSVDRNEASCFPAGR